MKFSKLCCMFAAASFAVGAFADAANVLISFSTEADCYADGTTVKDGEWYALCWSPRDTFGGLTLKCEPVNPDERVLILAPLAENGRCPYTIFEVDSADIPSSGGNYFVYVLDTRDANGKVAEEVDGSVAVNAPATTVNGAVAKTTGFTISSSIGTKNRVNDASKAVVSGESVWAPVQPRITAFDVCNNATVKITVAGVLKGIPYNVSMGPSIDEMTCFETTPEAEDGKVIFRVPSKDARFFKIVVSE